MSSDRIEYRDNKGLLHRETGPAFVYNTGHMYWYYHGKLITKCCIVGYAKETGNEILGCPIDGGPFYYKECYVELVEKHQEIFDRIVKLKPFW